MQKCDSKFIPVVHCMVIKHICCPAVAFSDGIRVLPVLLAFKMSLSCCEPTTCVEYKYVLVETGTGNTSWEDGDNRSVDVARGTRVSVSETWGDRESEKTSEDIAASPPPSPAPAAVTCTDTHDGEGQQDVQDSSKRYVVVLSIILLFTMFTYPARKE